MKTRLPHAPVAAAHEDHLQRFAAPRRGSYLYLGGLPPRLGTSPRSDAASPGSGVVLVVGPRQRGEGLSPFN
ncbi:hypothetical protein NDU88_002610 [Pleurodeles waltl]|uniref:Uncharacterized protein n=1 Tax=Pleurodeles waltl TaxID=8319 RepID=A0AAV7W3Q7_PLEWA|nr:hypothetical protein NDU88_002610 [Pleurodeles waltl]